MCVQYERNAPMGFRYALKTKMMADRQLAIRTDVRGTQLPLAPALLWGG